MYGWVPNRPLERFVQNAPRKELAITLLKSVLLGKTVTNKLTVSSTTDTLFKKNSLTFF